VAQIHNIFSDLPHNLEAEMGFLGGIFIDKSTTILDDTPYLKPEHFSTERHGEIYRAILDLHGKGKPVDPVTLGPFVENRAYLGELAVAAVTPIMSKEYARVIYDMWRLREMIDHGEKFIQAAKDSDTLDIDEILDAQDSALTSLPPVDTYYLGPRTASEVAGEVLATAEVARTRGGVNGLSTGFLDIDTAIGGLFDTDLLILAGRPGMGKTALASNIAINTAKEGVSSLVFSIEMSAEQLIMREVGAASGISAYRIRQGKMDITDYDNVKNAGAEIGRLPIFIDDRPDLKIQTIRAVSRRFKRKAKIGLIVIDYLQLMSGDGGNRVQEISQISRGLKILAKELKIPVLALSQLSRKCEDREPPRPQLQDLRDSGSIEQDADVVMFLYRKELYVDRVRPEIKDNEDEFDFNIRQARWETKKQLVENKAELIIAKQRHGPTGNVDLRFDPAKTRFETLARD
jgi:replicative DNA helicase